jgi:hypothetical protein
MVSDTRTCERVMYCRSLWLHVYAHTKPTQKKRFQGVAHLPTRKRGRDHRRCACPIIVCRTKSSGVPS